MHILLNMCGRSNILFKIKKKNKKKSKDKMLCIVHNSVQNDWDLSNVSAVLHMNTWIHECIMRGQNEPRKAHWTNPPRERKLFRVDEDTLHNHIAKENFFLSFFLYLKLCFKSKIRTTLHKPHVRDNVKIFNAKLCFHIIVRRCSYSLNCWECVPVCAWTKTHCESVTFLFFINIKYKQKPA